MTNKTPKVTLRPSEYRSVDIAESERGLRKGRELSERGLFESVTGLLVSAGSKFNLIDYVSNYINNQPQGSNNTVGNGLWLAGGLALFAHGVYQSIRGDRMFNRAYQLNSELLKTLVSDERSR
jgi:hypothetical protein